MHLRVRVIHFQPDKRGQSKPHNPMYNSDYIGSELRVKDLREHLSGAFTNIGEVLPVHSSDTFAHAAGESAAVREGKTESAGTKLTVLLVIVELSELSNDSVEVREVAVSIKFKSIEVIGLSSILY